MLEQLRSKLFEDYLPDLTFSPVVCPRTWQPRAPRCSVCAIGFVRFRSSIRCYLDSPEQYIQRYSAYAAGNDTTGGGNSGSTGKDGRQIQDQHLCLACALRRELFSQAQHSFPRSFRRSAQLSWPFMHRKTLENDIAAADSAAVLAAVAAASPPRSPAAASPMGYLSPTRPASPLTAEMLAANNAAASAAASAGFASGGSSSGGTASGGTAGPDGGVGMASLSSVSEYSGLPPEASLAGTQGHDGAELPSPGGLLINVDGGGGDGGGVGVGIAMGDFEKQQLQTTFSPVKSRKLIALDAAEAVRMARRKARREAELVAKFGEFGLDYDGGISYYGADGYDDDDHGGDGTGLGGDFDDLSSVHSQASLVSQLTESVAGGGDIYAERNRRPDEDSLASLSVKSTATIVDPMKKPRELALIPFLLSKGHFEDVERTVRIALGKHAVDEGEGLRILVKILALQAELYKHMGAWPLALAIYLDCVDISASLLGYEAEGTLLALDLVTTCLRKMQEVDLAGRYIAGLCGMIDKEVLRGKKQEMTYLITQQDAINRKEYLRTCNIWTQRCRPCMPLGNPLRMRLHSVIGLGGLYALLTAQDGFSIVCREAFYVYCRQLGRPTGTTAEKTSRGRGEGEGVMERMVKFVDYCFRLRICDDPEVRCDDPDLT